MSSNCTKVGPDCPADGSGLSYPPSLVASIIFTVIFCTSLAIHMFLGIKLRTWSFLACYILGSTSEAVGYIGRIFLHSNPYNLSTFLVQIVCLTTGPAFYSAGLYLCLARIIVVYGEKISRLRPIWYTRIFITCDIISLSLQGAGGGVASSATKQSTLSMGNDIMLAGLIFQIFTLALFAILCLEFVWRLRRNSNNLKIEFQHIRESRQFRGFLVAAVVTFVTIFIRCVYRVVELAGGWNNKLQREETPYIILESAMISVAVFAFSIFHPGRAFGDTYDNLHTTSKRNSKEEDAEMKLMPPPVGA
ncbi:RTA1 like protein-domain-containing protein [Talaromyces proteolyticus]|uniref:RTA1 like protein-domain-containing protein n=1 Tax=Talaromyces proteolyticus TaxID=1131652 RepID=A0AAD4KDG1_9EURO|nr:RTA1 like protein-domain-containing protein [Talaromyces proteolyticus]KAH8689095.1 RTA1 like protein-domain-containing protein [Talaromyces proteolyticus]